MTLLHREKEIKNDLMTSFTSLDSALPEALTTPGHPSYITNTPFWNWVSVSSNGKPY